MPPRPNYMLQCAAGWQYDGAFFSCRPGGTFEKHDLATPHRIIYPTSVPQTTATKQLVCLNCQQMYREKKV